jgi:hypothetical protein
MQSRGRAFGPAGSQKTNLSSLTPAFGMNHTVHIFGEIFDLFPSPKWGETPRLRAGKLLNQGFQAVLRTFFVFF